VTPPLRSARWFGGRDLAGFIHRASLAAATADGRPIVGGSSVERPDA